ncbi:MAG TPA: Flp1 family type IVb pilin [Anaerovoracaceae bacterium]|nr:Flp1 family type IVb pilin [Anaerovoracaceae bacterium]
MLRNKRGMELVQVAILVAIAVAIGIIFKSQITEFVNNTFSGLNGNAFN